MKCKHCGQELQEGMKHCPECGEPTSEHRINKKRTFEEEYDKTVDDLLYIAPILLFLGGMEVFGIWASKHFIVFTISLICYVILWIVYVYFYTIRKEKKYRWRYQIHKQFHKDRTSICPRCGSHDIIEWQRGYDWKEAYWGSVFGLKGWRYIAGAKSRNIMCKCEKCGHKWDSYMIYVNKR